MALSFFSEWSNILSIMFIAFLIIFPFILIKLEKEEILSHKLVAILAMLFLAFGTSVIVYKENFELENSASDVYTLSNLRIDINTFKEHEHKLPKERDFYLSGFLNDSKYFEIKDNKKIFAPIHNSDFKLKEDNDSLSFSYINYYDNKSFIDTGKAYRYCLNFPINLNNNKFEQIKVSINGKNFDYKKATIESMKDICYSDKPNHYKITFF